MENSWHTKLRPMWQQSPPVAASSCHDADTRFSSADCRLYFQLPQESMPSTRGMIQQHMITDMPGLSGLGHVDLGASFLSLLSGPSKNLSCGLQHLFDPKPATATSQASLNHRTVNGFSVGSRVPVLPSTLWAHNMDSHSLTSGEIFSHLISPDPPANFGNSSAAANLNFQKSPAVACQYPSERDKTRNFSYLLGNSNSGPIFANNWKLQKSSGTTASQKVSVENSFPAYHHENNPSGSYPRVFCSGISGNLLLGDTGLLGVVCSCHGFYMSISEFSEHSGSFDINPGSAVRMENGETIAHWWKTFFSKSGIRALECHREWDWPEGISAESGLTNHSMFNMSDDTVLLDQIDPFRMPANYEQQQYNMINSKEYQDFRNIIDERSYNEENRTYQECCSSLIKNLVNCSHANLQSAADQQIWDMSNSFRINREKAPLSITCTLDSIGGSANSLPPFPDTQNLKTTCNGSGGGRNTSSSFEGPGVLSNIELCLGHPPEQSKALEVQGLPNFNSNLSGVHAGPQKALFSDKLLLNASNELQGSKWALRYTGITSNPTGRSGSTQVECPNHMQGVYSAITDCQKDSSSCNSEMFDLSPPLLSFFKNPELKCQLGNTYGKGINSHVVTEKLHNEFPASKGEKLFHWSRVAGSTENFDANVANPRNHMHKGKGEDDLLTAANSNIEFPKTSKDNLSAFTVYLGESSSNYSPVLPKKSPNLHQMSMIADASYGRDILNNCSKVSCLSDMHFDHDWVKPVQNFINSEERTLMGFTSKSSAVVQSASPALPKEKYGKIGTGLQDDYMKMFSVQNMFGLSNGDNGHTSIRNAKSYEILKNLTVQSLLTIAPSVSEDNEHLICCSRMPEIPEVQRNSKLPGTTCWMGHNSEGFCTTTGRSVNAEDYDLPPLERLFLRPEEIESNFTDCKEGKWSQRLSYFSAPEKCSCAVSANCLTGKYDLNGDASCNLGNKVDRSEAISSLFHSKLHENCIFLKDRAKYFNRTENLVAPNIMRVESPCQWRDASKRIMGSCSSTRKEQQSFITSLGSCADVAKCFPGFVQNVFHLKECEISNITSGFSAPDVTQVSTEVNRKDSSTDERGATKCGNNLVLDDGSRNDRSWSSDGALDDDHHAEICGSASRTNLIKSGSFNAVPRKPSISLIEEIRLQNSLRYKKGPYHVKRSSTCEEGSDHLQKFEVKSKRRRKTVKWMKLDAPFPVSGQSSVQSESWKCTEEVGQNAHPFWDVQMPVGCDQGSPSNCADSIEQRNAAFPAVEGIPIRRDLHGVYHQGQQKTKAHKSFWDDGTFEVSEMFQKQRLRLDHALKSKGIQEICSSSAAMTAKLSSLSCPDSLVKPNFYKWMIRPIVFGKYGIISNGNPSKPTKIISLRKILKNAASYAEKHNDKLKSAPMKVKKTSVRQNMSLDKKVLMSQVRKSGTHDLLPIEVEPQDLKGKIDTTSCSETNGSDDLSYTSQKCNNHAIPESKPGVQLKTKFKEGRKRSLHELLIEGNGFNLEKSSDMKNAICQTSSRCSRELIEETADGKVQTNEDYTKRCSEKYQPENSDNFCCVCGIPDKDEFDQLFGCNRFLIKGLQSEDVDDENTRFHGRCMLCATSLVIFPDSDLINLQPGEKFLTCARTEGYKGRKREGFFHNRPQDANGDGGCLVPQEQLDAWLHIHRQRPHRKGRPKHLSFKVESDCRKAYTRYKQSKGWQNLVVYKSGIHALGLYTSQFISRGAMVVEYVGEIVGVRVADRRESEYHSGKKLQHKIACYFFRIDKEHIIDATRKGGIARFVNHSCQPNCVAKVISVRKNEKKVVFFAERDIYPGEEITYDYHFNHEDEGDKIPCYCNSKGCRRYLN